MNANVLKSSLFIPLIIVMSVFQPAAAQPFPPNEHIVSYEQFISGNEYAGEDISMSAKIYEIKWSKRDRYTIQLMPAGGKEEMNESVHAFVSVENAHTNVNAPKGFIRDEIIGLLLKEGYNIVVIGKAGELKEKSRTIYVDGGTVIVLLKSDEYREIKNIINPVVKMWDEKQNEPVSFLSYRVATRRIQHNTSADIFAAGLYDKLSFLDNNFELLDRDCDDLFDPIDPYPNEYDMDGDKLSDKEELEEGTDPGKNDTDDDWLSDWEEVRNGTDGYITKPLNPDTDGDTLSDYVETHGFERGGITFFTDPTNPDTDGDGIGDYDDPYPVVLIDADGDGLPDDEELKIGTNIYEKDTDGDGLTDFDEVRGTVGYKTDPLKKDTDGDELSDKEEVDTGLNPLNPDTDGDGLLDKKELEVETDPKNPDTDGDGIMDGSDKLPLDMDNDGWTDTYEREVETNPNNPDTDGDGIIDSEDNFPLLNNNLIYGLSCIPVAVILFLFIIHIRIGLTSNRKEKIKEDREKIAEAKKRILELAEEKKGYIFLDEVADMLGEDEGKKAKSYMKRLVRSKIAKKDKKDAYSFPEITGKYEK